MTPSRLAEIRARATETRHPLDLGHMYQRDVKELLEELAVERRASDLLCAASQKAVAAEREACAKVAENRPGDVIPVPGEPSYGCMSDLMAYVRGWTEARERVARVIRGRG